MATATTISAAATLIGVVATATTAAVAADAGCVAFNDGVGHRERATAVDATATAATAADAAVPASVRCCRGRYGVAAFAAAAAVAGGVATDGCADQRERPFVVYATTVATAAAGAAVGGVSGTTMAASAAVAAGAGGVSTDGRVDQREGTFVVYATAIIASGSGGTIDVDASSGAVGARTCDAVAHSHVLQRQVTATKHGEQTHVGPASRDRDSTGAAVDCDCARNRQRGWTKRAVTDCGQSDSLTRQTCGENDTISAAGCVGIDNRLAQ